MPRLKVGELAQRAGVSIRTLHYYEELGLLRPARTVTGHRRYDRAAIEHLQQIRSLQHLGFSLSEIGRLLGKRPVAAGQIVADQLAQIRRQRQALERLEQRLQRLHRLLASSEGNDGAEAVDLLLQTLEAMSMYEKHLTPEQLEQINAAHEAADAGAEARFKAALDGLRAELQAGTAPKDPKVVALARRWHEAAAAFMPAGDEAAHNAVIELLHDEPQARHDHGLDDELFAYLGRALAPDDHGQA